MAKINYRAQAVIVSPPGDGYNPRTSMRSSKILAQFRAGQVAWICSLGFPASNYPALAARANYHGVWMDGEHHAWDPREIEAMTSHVDLTATLLPRLGVASPVSDYSLGLDLLGDEHRPFQALSDWSRICFVDEDAKISFALKGAGLFRQRVTTLDDDHRHYALTVIPTKLR